MSGFVIADGLVEINCCFALAMPDQGQMTAASRRAASSPPAAASEEEEAHAAAQRLRRDAQRQVHSAGGASKRRRVGRVTGGAGGYACTVRKSLEARCVAHKWRSIHVDTKASRFCQLAQR